MKVRRNRWDHREELKFRSNRAGRLQSEHPQARREMQHHADDISNGYTLVLCERCELLRYPRECRAVEGGYICEDCDQ